MSDRWFPKEADLRSHAGRALEAAYRDRERVRCSRDDFADGWMAALRWVGSRSSFLEGKFDAPEAETDE